MKNSIMHKIILIISGLIASSIGATILLVPVIFYATYGITLGDDFGLLNEIKASGGALLASGILIMSGAFVDKLTYTAIMVSTLLYLSYGISRMMSIAIDGMPAEGFVQAAILEIAIGLVCFFALMKYREKEAKSA